MSIAQFDATSAQNVAARINAAAAKTSSNSDFARLLDDAQLNAQTKLQSDQQAEDTRRADAAKTSAADQRPSTSQGTSTANTGTKTADAGKTDASKTDASDKTHGAHHASRHGGAATDSAQTAADATTTPVPVPVPVSTAPTTTAAATPATANGDTTNADGTTTDGSGDAASTTASATANTTSTTTATAAAATAADDTASTDPALAALATLGLGRSAVPGAGTSVPPANGKIALANVSVTKAPAAVKLGALTTALPLEVDAEDPPAVNPTTVALAPAAASAAANVAADNTDTGPVDPNADAPAPAAFPADLAAALATAVTTTATTDPTLATVAAATTQHSSLFAQSGTDAASGTTALTSTSAPTTAGFATLNAGTTVSRADAAETPSQNGQTSQTPLPPPTEQLAIAINKNVGGDGSQNFTIRLSPEKLGSVEVQLKVDSKGKTTANFVVEHAATLGLLKQDSSQLLQSLQNAGVDTNSASLSFSLRDPNSGTAQNQSNGSQGRQTAGAATTDLDGTDAAEQPTIASNRLYDFKA